MQTFLALLLALASFAGYFVLATEFGVRQAIPWAHFLACLLAVVWLWRLLRRGEGLGMKLRRGAAFGFAVLLGGVFVWYTVDYSAYDQAGESFETRAVDGLSELRLIDHQGDTNAWHDASKELTLLVLYRGYW